jgi:hypothetical protein
MAIFKKNHSKDVLFLQTVRLTSEKLPRRKVRMLVCDASGRVFAVLISRRVYEKARDDALLMKERRKPFATIALEAGPGKYEPAAIEISPEEAWALEHILEHALKSGRLPDILKKYLRPIIERAESSIEMALATTPKVLDRLPYYPPGEIEISVPIYKAAYSYPLIVLKSLPPDEHTSSTDIKLLVLDSDGDLAAIRVPASLVRQAEREITDNSAGYHYNCLLISRRAEGLAVSYMPVSQPQQKALAALVEYFEVGGDKQPMSMAIRTVLSRAKGIVTATP